MYHRKTSQAIVRVFALVLMLVLTSTNVALAFFDTNQVGGTGGQSFRDNCRRADFRLVGFEYYAGKDLNLVVPMCGAANFDFSAGTYIDELVPRGNADIQTDFLGATDKDIHFIVCPKDMVVQQFHASYRHQIHNFWLTCRDASGNLNDTRTSMTDGGEGPSSGVADCGPSSYATGVVGGAGGLVDRLGLVCVGDAPQPPAPPPPPVPIPITSKTVMLESSNFPGMFIRHQNWQGLLTKLSSDLDYKDATFNIVKPGLTGAGAGVVSLESAEYPGFYLRHKNFVVVLEKNDGSDLFAKDASFTMFTVTGGVRFQSVNFPDRNIRHKNFKLVLDPRDGTRLYGQDSTFRVRPPTSPSPPTTQLPPPPDNKTPPPTPPANGGGGATAAVDTTIYDQPEGSDADYLNAGDPVTIVSCNDDNWCQISKPRKGWVWGDDLKK